MKDRQQGHVKGGRNNAARGPVCEDEEGGRKVFVLVLVRQEPGGTLWSPLMTGLHYESPPQPQHRAGSVLHICGDEADAADY